MDFGSEQIFAEKSARTNNKVTVSRELSAERWPPLMSATTLLWMVLKKIG